MAVKRVLPWIVLTVVIAGVAIWLGYGLAVTVIGLVVSMFLSWANQI